MLESKPSPEAGKRLRAERLRVRLSTRAVQKLSEQIAQEKNNQDYYISHGWLTDVEHTHLIGSLGPPGQTLMLPLDLRENVELARTNLVSRMFEAWGEIPVSLLQQLDLRHCLCGYIGLEDYTLYPLIRPGSFVEIDARQNKVKPGNWQSEFDRPIYFVELRNGYACSWCELDGTQLILVPSPQSRGQIRQVRYPADADIVGRVTAVTMRIAEAVGNQSKESPSSRTE